SSRMSTGGSCTIACASPTRRRKPFDSVSIVCSRTPPSCRGPVACGGPAAGERTEVGEEVEEAAHGHLAVARRPFRKVAKYRLGGECVAADVMSADAGAPRARRDETGEHAH